MAEQDRRLEGLKEIGAAFERPVSARTVRRYVAVRGLRVARRFGKIPWCMLSEVRRFEAAHGLASGGAA